MNRLNLGYAFYPYRFRPVLVFTFCLMLHSVFLGVECDNRVIK
jgi:hypothetical protein